MSKNKGFNIKDGVLLYYNGSSNIVNIPEGVTEIKQTAFKDTESILKFTPDNLIESFGCDFICKYITDVNLPSTFTKFNPKCFSICSLIQSYTVHKENPFFTSYEGCLYNKDMSVLIKCPYKLKGDFVIPSSVKKIEPGAFTDCSNLISVTIPYGVTKIEDSLFYGCKKLQTVNIPDTVYKICDNAFTDCESLKSIDFSENIICLGDYIFSGCSSLKHVNISPKNLVFCFEDGILYDKDKTTLIFISKFHDEKLIIPESITNFGKSFFRSASNLTYIKFSSSIKKLPDNEDFSLSLEYIDIDSNNPYFTSVDGMIFNKNKTILYAVPSHIKGDIILPDTTKVIYYHAFIGCSYINSLKIPQSVTKIWQDAFVFCSFQKKPVELPDMSMFFGENNNFFCSGEGIKLIVKSGSYGEEFAISQNADYESY